MNKIIQENNKNLYRYEKQPTSQDFDTMFSELVVDEDDFDFESPAM